MVIKILKLVIVMCVLSFTAFSWIILYSLTAALLTTVTPLADYAGMCIATIITLLILYGIYHYCHKAMSN